jgi:IS605 OrfB family transposase
MVHNWQTKGELEKPKEKKQLPSQIHALLRKRGNKINDYFNKVVQYICTKYKDCEKIIAGYNKGWKKYVNMGRKNNRDFHYIPYKKFIEKLRNKLQEQNQELVIINEAYTSKCDALALEEVCKHEEYMGNRDKRGLYSSSTGVLVNADINGAINIMRKWKAREEIKVKKIKGINICNPKTINVYEALCQQV